MKAEGDSHQCCSSCLALVIAQLIAWLIVIAFLLGILQVCRHVQMQSHMPSGMDCDITLQSHLQRFQPLVFKNGSFSKNTRINNFCTTVLLLLLPDLLLLLPDD